MSTFFQKSQSATVVAELHKNYTRLNRLSEIALQATGPRKRLAEILQAEYTERVHDCVDVIQQTQPLVGGSR